MKKLLLSLAALMLVIAASAQTAREELALKPQMAYGNYYAYPGPEGTQLTPAPAGYTPFYISHYGRHGSRYMCGKGDYTRPLAALSRAEKDGKLTAEGQDVLRQVRMLCDEAYDRYGELTSLGARQHRGIAQRMMQNFPEVFTGETNIEARSTIVIRCILSMENALQQLVAGNPQLKVFHDASMADMTFMNMMESHSGDKALDSLISNPKVRESMKNYGEKYIHPDRLMSRLFTDVAWARDSIKARQLYMDLFHMACDVQDVDLIGQVDLLKLFTQDEVYNTFQYLNIGWYYEFGASKLTNGWAPYSQRALLRNIIEKADSCIRLPHPGATLRYGHDTMVVPLACLLDVNGWGLTIDDPEQLAERGWRLYRLTPMATNLQFIFYRNPQKPQDILFKLLFCEKEATLPLKPVTGPYYRWADFKDYYGKKLALYPKKF